MTTFQERLVQHSATTWPKAGRGQGWLLAGALLVIVGSVLPWVDLGGVARIDGLATAGLWTFYIGFLGMAGGLVPWRGLAIAQGAMLVVAALALPAWQVLRLVALDLPGWNPGLGLLLVVAGGSTAARGVLTLVAGSRR